MGGAAASTEHRPITRSRYSCHVLLVAAAGAPFAFDWGGGGGVGVCGVAAQAAPEAPFYSIRARRGRGGIGACTNQAGRERSATDSLRAGTSLFGRRGNVRV